MLKQRIAHALAVFGLLSASLGLQAAPISVAAALEQPLGTEVETEGLLVAQHGLSYFSFSDGSSEIEVHITDAAWDQVDLIGPEDHLQVRGLLQSDREHPFFLEITAMQVQH